MIIKVNSSQTGSGLGTTQLQYLNSTGGITTIGSATAAENWILTFIYYGVSGLILLDATNL